MALVNKSDKSPHFVYLDAIHYKVREEGTYITKAFYTVLGVNLEGKKEILGLYLNESEGAKFWLQVLTDLQNRGSLTISQLAIHFEGRLDKALDL